MVERENRHTHTGKTWEGLLELQHRLSRFLGNLSNKYQDILFGAQDQLVHCLFNIVS